MGKRQVKVDFSGFWKDLDKEDNFFINTLRREFDPVISEKPDYLFFSLFTDEYLNYNNDVIRIFYTGESQIPDFNLTDYALGFDWIDFGDRYLRFPLYNLYKVIPQLAVSRGGMIEKPERRDRFCSFVCSNSKGDPIRIEFFKRLSERRSVDSGGKFCNNVGGPVRDKVSFEKEHRFSMCFENSAYPGYTTEKILEAFAAGTIPIYWGDPEIGRVFNEKAFVLVRSDEDMKKAIDRIIAIDDDPVLFEAMLKEEPFIQGNYPDDQTKAAEEFILNIFRQPKEAAFRRNRTFRGKNYELFFKRYCNINMKLRKIKHVFDK